MTATALSPAEKIKQLEAELEELQTQPQPRSYKAQEKLEKECEHLQKNISNWQSYAELEPGMLVSKNKEFGVIDSKMLSQGGMPIIWVTWHESTVPTPEQPSRLKIIPEEGVGSRVYLEEPTNTGIVLEVDAENNLTQVAFDSDPQKPIWIPTELLTNWTCAAESVQDFHLRDWWLEDSNSSDSPNAMTTAKISSQKDFQESPSTPTLDNSSNSNQEQMSSPPHLPANPSANKEKEKEQTTPETVSPQSSKQSSDSDPNSSLSKMLPLSSPLPGELAIQKGPTSKTCSVTYTKAATMQSGSVLEADTLNRPFLEKGYCWLESPAALSHSGKGRPPGLTRCESDLKKRGAISKGECLNPRWLEAWFNSPQRWLNQSEYRPAIVLLENNGKQPETSSTQEWRRSPSNGSSTTPALPKDESGKRSLDNSSQDPVYLNLNEIRRDGGTQPRAAIDLRHVKLLEEQMESGKELEPVIVFYDGQDYWLADGFHRWLAHRNQEEEVIACFIQMGTRRDAILYSVGANADHKPALPRSREDKRRAVMTLLYDPKWSGMSDNEIAQQCKVSQPFVSKLRKILTYNVISENPTVNVISEDSPNEKIYKTKHGTFSKMNTANIGKSRKKESEEKITPPTQELAEPPAPPPHKVLSSTDDICIAVISNTDRLRKDQAKAVVKAIIERWSIEELLPDYEPLRSEPLRGQACQLACCLEDCPEESLKGQSYELTSEPLRGQACQLACCLEDCPEESLKGQSYELTCCLEDCPEDSPKEQSCEPTSEPPLEKIKPGDRVYLKSGTSCQGTVKHYDSVKGGWLVNFDKGSSLVVSEDEILTGKPPEFTLKTVKDFPIGTYCRSICGSGVISKVIGHANLVEIEEQILIHPNPRCIGSTLIFPVSNCIRLSDEEVSELFGDEETISEEGSK